MNRPGRLSAVIVFATTLGAAGCAVPTKPASASADHAAHTNGKTVDRNRMWQASLARAPLAVTVAFDRTGRLWRARVRDGQVWLDRSLDQGQRYSDAVAVNSQPERIAADGENRPKLAFGPAGEIYVSWTQSLDVPFSGHVRFARSLDGGHRFSAPLTVNDNLEAISHRFDSMTVTPAGHLYLVWLDKRDAQVAVRAGRRYTGISVYGAVSTDRGASFAANRKLAEHSCECCRIALALDTDGTPVAVWRHVFGANTRDHALLRLDDQSQPVRVTHENWALDACPHHGPALGIGRDGVLHLAWYSGAEKQRGLFYAHSRDHGTTFTPPFAIGNPDAQAGHPQVLALGTRVSLVWKEFDGKQTVIRVQQSRDGGRTFARPVTLTASASASDHPLLVSDGARVLLSWNSVAEGHRLMPLPGDSP
jgi:hypothetical protein